MCAVQNKPDHLKSERTITTSHRERERESKESGKILGERGVYGWSSVFSIKFKIHQEFKDLSNLLKIIDFFGLL